MFVDPVRSYVCHRYIGMEWTVLPPVASAFQVQLREIRLFVESGYGGDPYSALGIRFVAVQAPHQGLPHPGHGENPVAELLQLVEDHAGRVVHMVLRTK